MLLDFVFKQIVLFLLSNVQINSTFLEYNRALASILFYTFLSTTFPLLRDFEKQINENERRLEDFLIKRFYSQYKLRTEKNIKFLISIYICQPKNIISNGHF